MSIRLRSLAGATTLCVTLLSLACSSDPQQQKREYFDSGNRYFGEKKYAEAVVEYRNAIQIDPQFGEAYEKLYESLLQTGDAAGAGGALLRAADLLPNRDDLQLKAGNVLLLSRRFEDARTRADKLLAANPRSVEAQILKANALGGLKEMDKALAEIEQAIKIDPTRVSSFTTLGSVRAATGKLEEAEAAYRKAVELEPTSIPARLALGNFLWMADRASDAEAEFLAAWELDRTHALVNRALATLYLSTNRSSLAEQFLKVLADNARDAGPKLALAEYYVLHRRLDEALATLEPLRSDRAAGTDARVRIAGIKYLQKQTAEAYNLIDEVLDANPQHRQALLTRARFLASDGKVEDALPFAVRAAEADPTSAESHYLVGTLQARAGRLPEAQKSLLRVVELNPRAVAAQIQLAVLELEKGNSSASLEHARDAVAVQPENARARLLLARGRLEENDLPGTEREVTILTRDFPKWSLTHSTLALLRLRQQNLPAARAAFEQALALDPKSTEAFAGLTTVDILTGRLAEARTRVEQLLAASPNDPGTSIVASRAYVLMKDEARAEALLKSTIEKHPARLQAYGDLAQLYVKQGRLDEARTNFERVAERQPRSVPAQTMIGILLQTQNRPVEAIKRYEQALAVDKQSAVAANNLAWIYAEQGQNLERALELAKTAKQMLPERADVSDTLGYVYLRKNAPDLAVPALRQAVSQDPENPTYRLRLGVALAKAGRDSEAKAELTRALKGHPQSPEANEARGILARLR